VWSEILEKRVAKSTRPPGNNFGVGLATWMLSSQQHTMPPTPTAVVLLVQADADNREMYTEFLRYEGFLPVPVSTARDGLTVAPKVDIIVTGLLLPGDMDGVEFIARLKRDERTKRIPVIVLTACVWKSDRERAEEAGCDVFLPKPCHPDDLLRNVQRLLAASKLQDVRGVSAKADLPSDVSDRRERAAVLKRR
jgi:CheY-like chemotaxis protein